MRNIISIITVAVLVTLFTGCSSKINFMTDKDVKYDLKKVDGFDDLYKVSYSKSGKHHQSTFPLVYATMTKTKQAVNNLGYKYFQIIAPAQISNLHGFPINKVNDFASFVSPASSMPREELGFFETKRTLLLNQEEQNIVDVPFTVFQDTKFNFVIRVLNNPKVDDIVWSTN